MQLYMLLVAYCLHCAVGLSEWATWITFSWHGVCQYGCFTGLQQT